MDDIVTVTATPQELEYVRGLAEREVREANAHNTEVAEIVKIGQREFGAERFDKASQAFHDALGERTQATMQVLRHSQTPHRHIVEIAEDPQKLERFAKHSIEGQRAEISSKENRNASYGRVTVAADPAWKSPALSGKPVSDADWNSGIADRMSDKDAFAEIDRRWRERAEKRGGRW
jgi:hypothetical protein